MFQQKDASIIVAPIGCVVYSGEGQTIHRTLTIGTRNDYLSKSSVSEKSIINNLKHMARLMVDNRSLLSAKILGIMKMLSKIYAHNKEHQN